MKFGWKRKASLGLAIVLITALFAGCGSRQQGQTETASEPVKVEAPSETVEESVLLTETENVEERETETESVKWTGDDTDDTFLLYISGIDVWGATETESRSDVNLLLAVNRLTHTVQMVNTPRDYYVPLPISGGSRDKLTHAGIYGVEVSKGALEDLYDVEIDYFLRLNFSGFEAIIDAIGGIDVYSEYDFTVEPIKHYTEGMNHLTGLESLAFVRERKSFAAGDVQRGINQMEMVKALLDKFMSEDILKTYNIWMDDDLKLLYQTNMPKELLLSLMTEQTMQKNQWIYHTYYVTGYDSYEYTYSVPGMEVYVMIPDEDQVAEGSRLLKETLAAKSEN